MEFIHKTQIYNVLDRKRFKTLTIQELQIKYKTDFVLKMIDSDYITCQKMESFNYFNIGFVTHQPNKHYAPALLTKEGNSNIPGINPTISIHPDIRFIAIEIFSFLPEHQHQIIPFLKESLLQNKSLDDLKYHLLQRYKKPEFTPETILNRTITLTKLKRV